MATYLAEIFAFVIIIAVIYRYVVPLLRKAMARRQATIGAQFEEARQAKEEAEAAEASFRQSVSDAGAEATHIRESAQSQAGQIIEELRARAHQEAERVAERGRQQVAAERDRLVRELRLEMGTLAVSLAGRIVHEVLADERRRSATVDRFLAELDRGTTDRPTTAAAGVHT